MSKIEIRFTGNHSSFIWWYYVVLHSANDDSCINRVEQYSGQDLEMKTEWRLNQWRISTTRIAVSSCRQAGSIDFSNICKILILFFKHATNFQKQMTEVIHLRRMLGTLCRADEDNKQLRFLVPNAESELLCKIWSQRRQDCEENVIMSIFYLTNQDVKKTA